MAIFHSTLVTCPCGHHFQANLARSVNIKRNPAVRDAILQGEFHHAVCPECHEANTIERPFYYCDPDRQAVFLVQPRGKRVNHQLDGETLSKAKRECALLAGGVDPRQLRVVYGLDELREKLVAQDAQIDDRYLEMLKVIVLHEHPFLLRTPRLQLVLSKATPTILQFTACHHNRPRAYQIRLSRFLADSLFAQPQILDDWVAQAAPQKSLLSPDRRWVNFRRLTVRYSALDTLRRLAKTVRNGDTVDLSSAEFTKMCARLPRAVDLASWAKRDLRTLFDYAKSKNDGKAQDRLFEVRFGLELDDEWATNGDAEDIDTIWNLMRHLPANSIEGNTKLKEVELVEGGGGIYQWSGVIQIGATELKDKERLEDVLRHEIGHSVHAHHAEIIEPWLTAEFGWQKFGREQNSIDQWIELMGGWNRWGSVSPKQRVDISNALVQVLGNGGSWSPGPSPTFTKSHPWNRPNFGPRLAVEMSPAQWYTNYNHWYRSNGKAFFLNYWYAELMVINESALELVDKMPSNYALMSPFEFFAELYAMYYDEDDPKRLVIPASAGKWLDENIGRPDPDDASEPSVNEAGDEAVEHAKTPTRPKRPSKRK